MTLVLLSGFVALTKITALHVVRNLDMEPVGDIAM